MLIAINFLIFAAFGIDKAKVERGKRRISESTLLLLALFGGTPGAYAGRVAFGSNGWLHGALKYTALTRNMISSGSIRWIRSLMRPPVSRSAHPLIVHAAVVLLPLAALTLIVAACVPRTRRVAAPIALGLSLVATVAVVLAEGSGEELEHRVERTAAVEDHTERAETVLPWALVMTAVAGVAVIADPVRRRWEAPSPRAVTAVLVGASHASER